MTEPRVGHFLALALIALIFGWSLVLSFRRHRTIPFPDSEQRRDLEGRDELGRRYVDPLDSVT